ncbi:MAG: hypothetical protein JRI94_09755 [Deltaproteobacteria bacterium]|nr:hypothetical protein [Deltaproteobacteria bacterium]
MNDPKIIAMIPVRIGSTRLKMKNLALVKGMPLIYYAIRAAQDSGVFDRIVINSDHEIFKDIAIRYHVEFYHRPSELGSSTTKSDDVVMDFMEKNPCDVIAWVNPTSPLQTGEEVGKVVRYFQEEALDSLITVKDEQVHCVYKGEPINFELEERFAQTQDLIPVQAFVYSVMMWRTRAFISQYRDKGYALFCGKTGYFPVSRLSAIVIKRQEDLVLADFMLRASGRDNAYKVQYDRLTEVL